ncbi:MAG TPA: DUF4097 family beta strand repeat-containing protein [Gemmatimonadaceae bacterium]|nr:DUF4097 family beta strand repeat-containing protein [Gemmatimonadaceae bacterium]
MRTVSLILAVTLMAISQLGGQSRVNRGLRLNTDGAVRIYNLVGSVRVVGWNRDSVSVKGSLGKGNTLHMGGSRPGMKMFVEGEDERNPAPANLEVFVPARAKVWVKTATASIEVSGVTGSLDLYVVGGDIKVTGNPADVNAEAIDGSITLTGSPAWVRAKSASGNVTLNGSSSDVTISTVSGKISASGTQFEKAKFETVTGGIRFSGSFERGGLVNFDTHSGAIEIGIPPTSPADFEVVSIAGKITNTLTSTRPVAGRYGRGAELITASGDGGTRVVIRSFKGPVALSRKP